MKKIHKKKELGRYFQALTQFFDFKFMLEMSEEEKESQLIEETEIEIQNLH